MKQLVCEMCGSIDLIKQDGVFVCQHCGCKYSIEEAKKMMIEGNVDVSGSTVKIDMTKELENLYNLARRAKDDDNSENAARYYDQILIKDPMSWEACFYSVLFTAKNCKIAEIGSAGSSVANNIGSVFALMINAFKEDADGLKIALQEVCENSRKISLQLFLAAANTYVNNIRNVQQKAPYILDFYNRGVGAIQIDTVLGDKLRQCFGNYIWALAMANEAYGDAYQMWRKFANVALPHGLVGIFDVPVGVSGKTTEFEQALSAKINATKNEMIEVKQRRIDTYWAEHSTERNALEIEKSSLEEKIESTSMLISSLPETASLAEYSDKVKAKEQELAKISIFKRKEIKTAQAELDALTDKLESAKKAHATVVAPLNESIEKMQARIAEIDTELTKER